MHPIFVIGLVAVLVFDPLKLRTDMVPACSTKVYPKLRTSANMSLCLSCANCRQQQAQILVI